MPPGTARAGRTPAGHTPDPADYDGDLPWTLDRQVALRPEPFGALAYHFGTRRLSFLKSRSLLAAVEALADHPTGDTACAAVGVGPDELPSFQRALGALAASGMIRPRGAS